MANPGRKPAGDTTPEALFLHCQTVYNKMMEHAEARQDDQGKDIIVYEGILTSLIIKECNLSTPYYSSVTKALKGMGCIHQLKRGGGTASSMWELITEPTLEKFQDFKPPRPPQTRITQMQEQLDNLENRIQTLERIFAKVVSREGEIVLDEEEDNG